jgi:hypothetical protein
MPCEKKAEKVQAHAPQTFAARKVAMFRQGCYAKWVLHRSLPAAGVPRYRVRKSGENFVDFLLHHFGGEGLDDVV